MFSIAAINDTNTGGQWEPLAPTKEALEFHLSQTYHEGLLKLHTKDYAKAGELLEAVLKDPLISSIQLSNYTGDSHLLQLRFLSLKNLATVFLKQGSAHYENALHCYLQAAEIDANDSVVWNQLGTLSCTMGLLSTSRWAFEQGLLCSPNNWNCMEKLMEVLIAIGDEVACLSVAELILRHWPSHSRALCVKHTIEDAEPIPFAPRGIDKLEAKHVKLRFPEKRKATEDQIEGNIASKRCKQRIQLNLKGGTWAALVDTILGVILPLTEAVPDAGLICSHGTTTDKVTLEFQRYEQMERRTDTEIELCLPLSLEAVMDFTEGKGDGGYLSSTGTSVGTFGLEKSRITRDREICDKEHHQERRSSRIERLKSRKSGKEELEFVGGKDSGKVVLQFLESFILNMSGTKDYDSSGYFDGLYTDVRMYSLAQELKDVGQFISETTKNYGAYHLGHLILKEVARIDMPFQDSFAKFLELEKVTRHWGQDRTPLCALYLAELYYDRRSWSKDESKQPELLSDASYHLCKVIELVALDSSYHMANVMISKLNVSSEMTDLTTTETLSESAVSINMVETNNSVNPMAAVVDDSVSQDPLEENPIKTGSNSFWVRFFWLSGCVSLSYGCKKKAFNEFSTCLSLLTNCKDSRGTPLVVFRPHCKLVRLLTVDRVLYTINLLKLGSLVGKTTGEMIEKAMYKNCEQLLTPLLFSTKDVYLDVVACTVKENERVPFIELLALDDLMLACEKAEPMDAELYLNCHRKKLQILAAAAGMIGSPASGKDFCLLKTACGTFDLDHTEANSKHWMCKVKDEVKGLSRSVSWLKNFIDKSENSDCIRSFVHIVGDIQSLLLNVMSGALKRILNRKTLGSGTSDQTDQLESGCLVDAAIAFCKLQHLDPSLSVQTQVDLIVATHDLLAEYGLCCAGRDSAGEEGTFLRFAIKHLLALDAKLKSLNDQLEMEKHRNGCGSAFHPNAERTSLGDSKFSSSDLGSEVKEKTALLHKDAPEASSEGFLLTGEYQDKEIIARRESVDAKLEVPMEPIEDHSAFDIASLPVDTDMQKVELGIENALDQSFFCLYGLNINPDSLSEDELVMHKNTNRGDYQTKEQCADVFQYILPYARALSRAGLVKLRRVLRAIRKHFPQPPNELLLDNTIDKFLDGPNICEDILSEVSRYDGQQESILNILFTNGRSHDEFKNLLAMSSEPYLEVYSSLYYLIAQAEEISATDKCPGFVLKKEGEEFVEQNASLFKYDLLYNPLRFESWQKLANIYDEEVDLLLNDGSKHMNIVDWRKDTSLSVRVENGRRRSRRCLLMSLALARTPMEQSQIHELLALVYYDSLQNVVPFYDQRSVLPTRDAAWMRFCQKSMKHFEKAFALKPDWLHAFYLGKLCEKMKFPFDKALTYYSKAASLNPSAVDPVYRMHASRLKLLYTQGKQNLDVLQIVAAHTFKQSTKDEVLNKFHSAGQDLLGLTSHIADAHISNEAIREETITESHLLDEAWHTLYGDCLLALEICVEGELKHFHKARYMLAQGLYKRSEGRDLERAKDELSFCFKSSRSSFTINMWEIDGTAKKGRRKSLGPGGGKRSLEVSLSESSRKFITCIRKYILLYLNLLERTGDVWTLERAYVHLRTDKRFSLCLGDIIPAALAKYIQVITSLVHSTDPHGAADNSMSLEQLLEKMFNILMDHVHLWAEICSLPEVSNPKLSESNLCGYIHQYLRLLESDIRLDAIEGANEKIRKRFKNPKLSSNNFVKICKHASLAWCRTILMKLAFITPLPDAEYVSEPTSADNVPLLFIDLQPDELLSSSLEGLHSKGIDMNWYEALSKIKNINVRQTLEENIEAATALMRSAYSFYRECSCASLPSGINLYTVTPSQLPSGGSQQMDLGASTLDLSIPRKLLLWAYTLVHGRYASISAVVKFCEEHAKSRIRRGNVAYSAPLQTNVTTCNAQAGSAREKNDSTEGGKVADNPLVNVPVAPMPEGGTSNASYISFASNDPKKSLEPPSHDNLTMMSNEPQKSPDAFPQLLRCSKKLESENE